MTNASMKTMFSALSVVAAVVVLSMGAFAVTVHAQEDFGFSDSGCCGYDYYDTATPSYDYYDTATPSYDYYDTATPSYDYYDTATPNYDYYDTATPNYDYYDTASPNYDVYDTASPNYDVYDTASANYDYYDTEWTNSQYQSSQGYQYSTGGQMAWHATPMTITPPTYRPVTPSYPVYPTPTPVYPTPRPTPTTPSYVNTTTTTTNTCTYNSCNTSYVDNSINGSFNTNTAPVYVANPQPIIQYVQPIQAPYCTITIGQGYQSGMVSLTWSSTGATSAYISPNIGTVNVNGSTNIYAYGNAVYTLTVTGQGGTYTCRTQSYIAPQAPTSPYVSLSQIPYTGFDFGTFGNAMYWLALLSFAVAGAYLVVYYQGGALALAGNMFGKRTVSYSEVTTESAPVETEVAHEVHEAPAALFNLPTTSASSTKDHMTVAHAADGTPRIVITRA